MPPLSAIEHSLLLFSSSIFRNLPAKVRRFLVVKASSFTSEEVSTSLLCFLGQICCHYRLRCWFMLKIIQIYAWVGKVTPEMKAFSCFCFPTSTAKRRRKMRKYFEYTWEFSPVAFEVMNVKRGHDHRDIFSSRKFSDIFGVPPKLFLNSLLTCDLENFDGILLDSNFFMLTRRRFLLERNIYVELIRLNSN